MSASKRKSNGIARQYATKTALIEEALKRGIRQGLYVDRVPPIFTLAKEFGINFKTVRKAVTSLAKAGILESTRGRGTFVSPKGAALVAKLGSDEASERLVLFFMQAGGDVYGRLYDCVVSRLNRAHLFPVTIHEGDEGEILHALGRINPAAIAINRRWNQFPYARLRNVAQNDLRIVFVMTMETDLPIHADQVLADYTHGGYIATRHLVELGHRRILLLSYKLLPPPPAMIYRHTSSFQVEQGYRLALEEAGLLQNEMCLQETADAQDNRRRLRALLDNPATRPTAIFALGDFRLVVARQVIEAAGLKVPKDLALVGFYNTPHSEHFTVPLTSVSIREDELARLSAERIVARDGQRERIWVKPTLVVRESCGAKIRPTCN